MKFFIIKGKLLVVLYLNLMLLNGREKQRFCHVVCFLALDTENIHICIYSVPWST